MRLNIKNQIIKSQKTISEQETFLKKYTSLGLSPLRLLEKTKRPIDNNWQNFYKPKIFEFNKNHNIGLLTGVQCQRGFFTVIDVDLSRENFHTQLLNTFVITLFGTKFGSSVRVDTGGQHQGTHIWFFLDQPINEKITIPIDFSVVSKGVNCAIEIMCRSKNCGFNCVAPPSTVITQYKFSPSVDFENLGDQIQQIRREELINFVKGSYFNTTIKLAEICARLHKLYESNILDGFTIDLCLSDYLIRVLKIKETCLMRIAFNIVFAKLYDQSLTDKALARTKEKISNNLPTKGIGEVIDKIDDAATKTEIMGLMCKIEEICNVSKDRSNLNPKIAIPDVPVVPIKSYIEPPNGMFYILDQSLSMEAPEMLIEGIIPARKFMLLHAPPGQGKTTASIHIADIIIKNGNNLVLYFNLERKGGDVEEKIKLLKNPNDNIIIINPAEDFSLFDTTHQNKMLEFVQHISISKGKIDLIIIDSLMAATNGHLNDGQVGGAMLFFNKIASEVCSVLLIHHNNKGADNSGRRRIFGSSLIAGAVVLAFELQAVDECEFARKIVVSKSNIRDLHKGLQVVVGQYPGHDPTIFRIEADEVVNNSSSLLVNKCREILLNELINGEERLADDVRATLGNVFSESTISRASKQLNIIKTQKDGKRFWQINNNSIMSKLYRGR